MPYKIGLCHPHILYVSQVNTHDDGQAGSVLPKTTGKDKDAFYGNVRTQAERNAKDLAHQSRLALKSGDGFIADLQLARQDLANRLSGK